MAVTGPITGFKTTDLNTNATQDLGDRYVSKDYLLDVYPNIASLPGIGPITSPGVWLWGRNTYGQLGLFNIVHRSSPIQVGSLTDWRQVAGDQHTAAIKTDGTLWTWGNNGNGQLGLRDRVHRSSPVQVGALTNWKQVSVGGFSGHTLAVKTDGTLWSWGDNGRGQLASLNTTIRSSPVIVGALTNWKQTAATSSGSYAVKTDGTLWAWGRNTEGQLGLLNVAHRSSPVQVGTLTNWKSVNGSAGALSIAAVKTDGTLWAWGDNIFGQLGLLNVTSRSSPVQVGTLTNWQSAIISREHCLAIKTDGTLWAWGHNNNGQLGLSDIAHRSSPVQVGSLTNWKYVTVTGEDTSYAVKTNGTLWAWGDNTYGQLGLNDLVHRSSPVQVGSLTTWKSISGGYNHLVAISDRSY